MSKINPHFSEKTYLRMALEGASGIPANPTTRQMEALVSGGAGGGSSDAEFVNVKMQAYDVANNELVADITHVTVGLFWTRGDEIASLYEAGGDVVSALKVGSIMCQVPNLGETAGFGAGNKQYMADPDSPVRAVSGQAEYDEFAEQVTITGDCTITLNVVED